MWTIWRWTTGYRNDDGGREHKDVVLSTRKGKVLGRP